MCFMSLPPKRQKCPSKGTPKVSLEGARIILGAEGARFSFSTTSKLPPNLFIRQDFYGTAKAQALLSAGTTSAHVYSSNTQPLSGAPQSQSYIWPQYITQAALPPAPTPAPQSTGADLVTAVSEAQRLACNLKVACASHSSCSSQSSKSSRSSRSLRSRDISRERARDRDSDRDRDTLLLSIERKNAEEIAALKLDRDIETKIKNVIRDRGVQALVGAAAGSGGLGVSGQGGGCHGGGNDGGNGSWGSGSRGGGLVAGEGWSWGSSRAQLEMEREDGLLQEPERGRDLTRDRERRLLGAGGGGDAHCQFNLFQDLSGGGVGGRRGKFVDGIRDGWERRRSSVVSTLDRGARRLAEAMARVEAEVEFMKRRERSAERRRRLF